jgi:prepilin-type N-terminal cleavage/methylation domain-containing protein
VTSRAAPLIEVRRQSQAGYTLIELIVASAIGLIVMGALTSIVLTMVLGANAATGRVEASAQIRNFQLMAYDDFALSRPPNPSGCGTLTNRCTTQQMILTGNRMPNQTGGVVAPFTAKYAWDPSRQEVTRYVGSGSQTAASNVTGYSWYVDMSEEYPVVVVSVTVTVGFYNTSYSESQTLMFYPRVTAP